MRRVFVLTVLAAAGAAPAAAQAAAQTAAQGQRDPGTVTLRVAEDVGRLCYRAAMGADVSGRAMRLCDRAVETYADHPRNLAASLTNRGTLRYLVGRYAEAAGDFTRALAADGDKAVILANRGLAYEQLSQAEPSWEARARADYEAALRLVPDYPVARRRMDELAKPRRERRPLPARLTA